eukprot:453375-Rhodomonas_salina.1
MSFNGFSEVHPPSNSFWKFQLGIIFIAASGMKIALPVFSNGISEFRLCFSDIAASCLKIFSRLIHDCAGALADRLPVDRVQEQ